ncbi:hypothetical protein J2S53_003697 [Actinopolyspora lacussalsi]|nr:hypothetical protein [Actinopolyspora lacussalsi]
MSETIVRSGEDAQRRLRELGLRASYMDEAVHAGVEARRLRGEFEPRSAAGLRDWIARVGKLRSLIVAEMNWRFADPQNVPVVFDPDSKTALGVLLGDNRTGNQYGKDGPRSKYPKGKAVSEGTAVRGGDSVLTFDVAQPNGRTQLTSDELGEMDLWFLVTYSLTVPTDDGKRFEVHREVSFAEPIKTGSYITRWRERLLLPKQTFDPVAQPYGPEKPKDIDVYVAAK